MTEARNQLAKDFFVEGAILQTDPHSAWMGWGGGTWSPTPAAGALSFYAPDFYLKSPSPWFIPRHSVKTGLAELEALIPPSAAPSRPLRLRPQPL